MTFAAEETSLEGGEPVEIYDFALGGTTTRFTSAEDQLTINSLVYEPAEVRRRRITVGVEQRSEVLEIEIPSSNPLVRDFINSVPGQKMSVTIRRFHRGDVGVNLELMFKGIVRSVAFTLNGLTAKISALPLTAGLNRTIPRFTFQGLCNHVLYDGRCKVVESSFRFNGTVSAVSGDTVTIPGLTAAKGAGFATAGFISLGGTDFRLILDHPSDTVKLLMPFSIDISGADVEVFAGCAHTLGICKTKFNNVINYGGFAFVPLKDIFANGLG